MAEPECPGPGWRRNPGNQPQRTRRKRVRVILGNGNEAKGSGTATAPPGWDADKANWSLTGWDFDIIWYLVL